MRGWQNILSEDEDTPQIIGRIAFTAVSNTPQSNFGNMGKLVPSACVDSGINAVANGANAVSESENLNTGTKPDGTPVVGRPGVNVNEIYLEALDQAFTTSVLQNASVIAANPGGQLPNGEQWIDLETMFNYVGIDDADSASLRDKLTVDPQPDPEAFWIDTDNNDLISNTEMYHRFNLARTDWDSVMADSIIGTVSPDTVLFTEDTSMTCIPWIKNWKSIPPGDTNADTIRNQIATNLIDYCDLDNEATTDFPTVDPPTYTGNEKTPYINEVKAVFEGMIYQIDLFGSTLNFYLFRLRNIDIELVNMYQTGSMTVDAEVTYTYICTVGGTLRTGTVTENISIVAGDENYFTGSQFYSSFYFPIPSLGASLGITNAQITDLKVKLTNGGSEFYDYSYVSNGSSSQDLIASGSTGFGVAYFDFSVSDPRQNLFESDWTSAFSSGTIGLKNTICDPSSGDDPELNVEPWNISTAYIRNDTMLSPWELGFIHRGAAWQTINLKKYDSTVNQGASIAAGGSSYVNGDANILDQIKMTPNTTTLGKVNINNPVAPNDTLNPLVALFGDIYVGVIMNASGDNPGWDASSVAVDQSDAKNLADAVQGIVLDEDDNIDTANMLKTRAQVANISIFSDDTLDPSNLAQTTDAKQEEIIGKFINLTKGGDQTFDAGCLQILVIAQVIKKNKLDKDNLGTFDTEHDYLLSERRALITLERNSNTKKWKIARFEYVGE